MKPILLLNDEPETVRLMSGEVTSGGVAVRESEARALAPIAIAGAIRAQGALIATSHPTLRFHHQSNAR